MHTNLNALSELGTLIIEIARIHTHAHTHTHMTTGNNKANASEEEEEEEEEEELAYRVKGSFYLMYSLFPNQSKCRRDDSCLQLVLLIMQIITLQFTFTEQKHVYPSAIK